MNVFILSNEAPPKRPMVSTGHQSKAHLKQLKELHGIWTNGSGDGEDKWIGFHMKTAIKAFGGYLNDKEKESGYMIYCSVSRLLDESKIMKWGRTEAAVVSQIMNDLYPTNNL